MRERIDQKCQEEIKRVRQAKALGQDEAREEAEAEVGVAAAGQDPAATACVRIVGKKLRTKRGILALSRNVPNAARLWRGSSRVYVRAKVEPIRDDSWQKLFMKGKGYQGNGGNQYVFF